jgi:TetR/AcrR family transcriptional repressor of nem operon
MAKACQRAVSTMLAEWKSHVDGAPVRHAVTACLRSVLEFPVRLTPGKGAATKRRKAIATFATMVGALVIARAVNDRSLSEEILKVVSASLAATKKA